MSDFDRDCDTVLRAAYQISGFTGARVSFEQIVNVTAMGTEELGRIANALLERGLISAGAELDGVELTDRGLTYAQRLPPISEPPLFQDI